MLKQSQNAIEIVPAKLSNYMLHGRYNNRNGIFPSGGEISTGESSNVPSTVRVLQSGKHQQRILSRKREQLSMFQAWRRRKLKNSNRKPIDNSMFSFFFSQGSARVRSTIVNEGILLSWRGVLYLCAFVIVVVLVSMYCIMSLYKSVRASQEKNSVLLKENDEASTDTTTDSNADGLAMTEQRTDQRSETSEVPTLSAPGLVAEEPS